MVLSSSRMVGDGVPRFRSFLFLTVGILFSLVLHVAVLSYFFVPLRSSPVEEAVGRAVPLTVADRLAAADIAILESGAAVLERVKRKRQEMYGIIKETPAPRWTLARMPRMYVRAAERVGINLSRTAVVPSDGQNKFYSITMELDTTPERVFEDLLTLAHWVGMGTAQSKFASDNLVITIREEKRGEAGRFVTTTRDCRLLSAGKLSAENFIARGQIEEAG
ncbi:hypothetical protein MYX19_05535 [Nitrospinae bacterium AH-259-F20]|nr:hypothetical protein [Nitrospinae bacterium AH-259-F20]